MAKQLQSLIHQISTLDHLESAWKSLNRYNRRSHGLSGLTIDQFESNLENNLKGIAANLSKGSYVFDANRAVAIPKKTGGYRPIRVPEIKDRVVLKAIAIAIEDILNKKYNIQNIASYAYRKGVGVENAIERMVQLYYGGNKIILESDIEKFFDTVPRQKLLDNYIYPVLPDNSINELIYQGLNQEDGNINDSTEMDLYNLFQETSSGIPQGSALSPLFANVYLSDFDNRMLAEGFGLIRYADDFVVSCQHKDEALRAYELAQTIIEKELMLSLHPLESKKTNIVHPGHDKFHFLSISFNGRDLWPIRQKVTELKEKIRIATRVNDDTDVFTILNKTRNVLYGWLASFHYTDVNRYFEEIDDYVNKELANALRKVDWVFKSKYTSNTNYKYGTKNNELKERLSDVQRKRSGVMTCEMFLKSINSTKLITRVKKHVA